MNQSSHVTAYTDGACIGNPGPGGWAAIILQGTEKTVLRGHNPCTTNNRMELQAALEALTSTDIALPLTIISDSQYVVLGATKWLPNWKANQWRTSDKKAVKNTTQWKVLDAAISARLVAPCWKWIRGHDGDALNEEADTIANQEAQGATLKYSGVDNHSTVIV